MKECDEAEILMAAVRPGFQIKMGGSLSWVIDLDPTLPDLRVFVKTWQLAGNSHTEM